MKLRCIICNAPSDKVALSSTFTCIDTKACKHREASKAANKVARQVSIFFDCACLGPNTKEGALMGVGIYTMIDGVHSPEHSGIKAIPANHIDLGEFTALCYALSIAKIMRGESSRHTFKIFGDNQAVIRTFNDEYRSSIKNRAFYNKSKMLQRQLGISLSGVYWIPRTQNKFADELSKQALLLHPIK